MLTQVANDENRSQMVTITERDIVFDCPHCRGELVVDQEGAGMSLGCSHCGRSVTVPARAPAAQITTTVTGEMDNVPPPKDPVAMSRVFGFDGQAPEQIGNRVEELKRQLKENQSQATEMRGHVNRATIDLHRLQLKLQKLQDRQSAIEAELLSAKSVLEQKPE